MPEITVQRTRVYDVNDRSAKRYLVNVGGAGSSKSHSIGQKLVNNFLTIPKRKIAICRKTFPSLRLTAYRLVLDLLAEYGVYGYVDHDKSSHIVSNPSNGAYIAFISVDDPEKIKSTDWNDIWMEEATEFTWDDWIVIQTRLRARTDPSRPNKIYLSLNPSDEQSWINQKLMLVPAYAENVDIIHSDYRDNPFLDKEYIAVLESLRDQDENAYNVYALGQWGKLTNIIYAPYEMLTEFPACGEKIYGLDFGFNNPSALVEIGIVDRDRCYLRELLYEIRLTNTQLIARVKGLLSEGERVLPLYADCAEPDRIEEFKQEGFNIHPSDKEVGIGIDFCKRKRFYTLPDNVNLNKERASYKWRTDKNGNVLEEPVKFMDHLMDAKRYAIYTHQKGMVDWSKFMGKK